MGSLKENIKGIEWAKFVVILFTVPLGVLEINTANYFLRFIWYLRRLDIDTQP